MPRDPYNLNIPGYLLIRKDAAVPPTGRRRGGAAMYIRVNIPHRVFQVNTTHDIQVIEIKTTQSYIAIINFYAQPTVDMEEFITDLYTITNNITTPYIMCGDINAHHPIWDRSRTQPDAKGQLFYNFINAQNLVLLNDGSHTFPSRTTRDNNTTPDITATTPALALQTTWNTSPDPLSSDHLPIHINIEHNTTPTHNIPRYNIKKTNWHEYTEHIENTNITRPTVEEVTNTILQAAQTHIPKTGHQHKPQKAAPWWNYECKRAITFRNTAKNRYDKNKTEENLINYKKARARCRKIIKEAKKTSFQEFTNTFNRFTPLSKIWKIIKAFKGHKAPLNRATIIIKDNITYSTPEEISELFALHYHNIALQCIQPTPLTITQHNDTQPYNAPLTLTELENAINRAGNTAPGPDEIHYHFFKHLGPNGKQKLLQAFNHAFSTHTYPDTWFHSHIIPIQKPHKNTSFVDSYRPISLTNTIHKIFERIIKHRLLYIIKTENLIIPEQCGFTPGRSTTDNLIRITADIKESITNKKTTAALFLDLKNAYDTLNITTLLQHLRKKIKGHLIHYLNNYLTRRTFQVKYLGSLSSIKTPTTGLIQGAVLSPILFIIALNSTLTHVPHPSKIALYADDIVIWSTANTANTALKELDKSLTHVQNCLTPLNLHISAEKTQCVIFSLRKPTNPYPLTLHNKEIKITEEAKFLGVTLDRGLTFKPHIDQISMKAAQRINILRAIAGTTFGGDTKTLLKLYKSLIRPIIEYASIVFENAAKTHLHKLDVIQNTALRIATGAFYTTPTDSLHVYTNITTLTDRRTNALFRYFYKIQKIPNHPCTPLITYRSHRR